MSSSSSSRTNKTRRRLDVAIVGLPNAGKSQLLNALTQSPVSAVSRKRHTTRQGILGARTVLEQNTQLLFVDTPGFLRRGQAQTEGLRSMVSAATTEMANVDHTLLVVDAARALTWDVKETLAELMQQAQEAQGRVEMSDDDEEEEDDDDDDDDKNDIVTAIESNRSSVAADAMSQRLSIVLNKVDLVYPKSDLLDIAMEISDISEGLLTGQSLLTKEQIDELLPTFFYVSARKNEGVDDVLQFLLERATPCQVWDIDPEQSTSLTEEERVEEIVREKLYRCLHKEVPYSIAQRNLLFQVRKDSATGKPGLLVHQEIVVKTKSHQDLVFGSSGRTLERIRETAERDLAAIFGCRVVLQLQVKLLNKSRQRNWYV
jgi:GTP-binding protein Era